MDYWLNNLLLPQFSSWSLDQGSRLKAELRAYLERGSVSRSASRFSVHFRLQTAGDRTPPLSDIHPSIHPLGLAAA